MNRYQIIFAFTAVLLGIFLCFTIGCQPDKNNDEKPVEKPPEPPPEPPEEPPPEEKPPEPPPEEKPPEEKPPEPPPEEKPEEPPPEEPPEEPPPEEPPPEEPPPEEKPPEEKPPEPLYKTGTVLLIESDDYGYLARVTEDTLPDATEVPVKFFSAEVRKKAGDTVKPEDILRIREEPPDGWASRPIALEYFDGATWKHQMDVLELKDGYLLPEGVKGERRVEFANVRVPIAVH